MDLRRAVESAREAGLCVGVRMVRVRMEEYGEETLWHGECRDLMGEEWRAIGNPRAMKRRNSHRCSVVVGSLLYVIGGRDADYL